ncbi:type II toxin-antitoxin system VapC family toxin [Mycobacterium shinjukuense]|uniref:Ribonuclease VapC n=1 Tax=Mycobacterium shinjukuense TaxID=398694 RepID=A0A7I7MV31_9MYCO|nr:type II toxin-antitoxin system VapC family toxin [Mycobacterium shinjukuense]MCV6987546.1 type II toxin-antitoxin system VapC family toxin [Mycobacterium shinjukuense]ORB69944.1 VapC toxin family PIN domain ribonuclease [Mycobacterium shinjukuense]BBX75995.1 ribonuclease VapC37 [Mycobacterium shinjukuense]
MRLLDLNILIYAIDESSPRHGAARGWLEETLSGSATVAFPWHVLVGFVRLSTRATVFERPLTVDESFDIVDGWLEQPCVTVVHPTDRHAVVLRGLLAPFGTAGNLTSDAHLAALSLEHGAELCSTDIDFSRFSGVRWVDPLQT